MRVGVLECVQLKDAEWEVLEENGPDFGEELTVGTRVVFGPSWNVRHFCEPKNRIHNI